MSLFNRLNAPKSSTEPPAASPAGDPSQKAAGAQHTDAAKSSEIGTDRSAEIAEADSLLRELDPSTTAMVRSTPSVPCRERADAPAPPGAVVPSTRPPNSFISEWNAKGKPVFRDKTTGALAGGGGALTGSGKGRAPGLAKMIDGMVHMPGIISFLQDVAIGKLAAGTKMADRIKAAEILLDRRYGKPSQHVEIKDDNSASDARKQAERMTTEQLRDATEKMRELLAKHRPEVIRDAEIVEGE